MNFKSIHTLIHKKQLVNKKERMLTKLQTTSLGTLKSQVRKKNR